jgi:endoglycosylceramidase
VLAGPISAPGGPYLRDRFGRAVLLHGVNAVYKYPPYLLAPTPGHPWSFSATDAAAIARLGLTVVRLGILWQALEPGHGGPNDPAVCSPGPPGDPGMFDPTVADAYLSQVARTVALLGRYHVYTILDMHQDVYNQGFRGEGAPAWAVCTNGRPVVALPGRWSRNYGNGALDVAVAHFWKNDVVGDLQGEYDRVWGVVAGYFRTDPWVLGYDPYNEPFELEIVHSDTQAFAADLECFYTGRAHPGYLADSTDPVTCSPDVPPTGVVSAIEAADPHHLVFVEPDVYSGRGGPNLLGPMAFPNLVLNFHSYCSYRNPVTGDPTDVGACAAQQLTTMLGRERERPFLASRFQPGGPAWFLSEFGATHSTDLLDRLTGYADLLQLGWAYWSWKYYGDPTGSAYEALAAPGGGLEPTAAILSRTYPEAIAGTPISVLFDPPTGTFQLVYAPSARIHAPTIIFVPAALHYPRGYCTTVTGGRVVSSPGASHLLVASDARADDVDVTVTAGRCPARGGHAPSPTTSAGPPGTG